MRSISSLVTAVTLARRSVSAALGNPPDDLYAHRNVANALRRSHARWQRLAQVHLEGIVLAHLGDPHSHDAGQGGQQRLGGFFRGPRLLEADGHVRPTRASP